MKRAFNRFLIVVFAPVIAAFFLFGFMLYVIGGKHRTPHLQVTGSRCMDRLRGERRNDQNS